MRIPEDHCNIVLLATVMLFTTAVAGLVALMEPSPASAPANTASAYHADQTPVRVVGGAPFVPNVNPREHR